MPDCFSLEEVKLQLNNQVDYLIDGGHLSQNKPSTIVNCKNESFRVIRQGAITLSNLNRVCKVF